jgi:hypothetical protein
MPLAPHAPFPSIGEIVAFRRLAILWRLLVQPIAEQSECLRSPTLRAIANLMGAFGKHPVVWVIVDDPIDQFCLVLAHCATSSAKSFRLTSTGLK